MDGMQAKTATVDPATDGSRPVWQKPELTEIAIETITRSPYALGGNDGTPSITSIS